MYFEKFYTLLFTIMATVRIFHERVEDKKENEFLNIQITVN